MTARIRIAMQKSGRLTDRSLQLMSRCGLNFAASKDKLFWQCADFPVDLMLVRDDDIPEYVSDGVCELGIVGINVLTEKLTTHARAPVDVVQTLADLDFGHCRLSLAVPREFSYQDAHSLEGLRVATSYPVTTTAFLTKRGVKADIVPISGSVEIAPALRIADAVCDLVSTGETLRSNGLKEVERVLDSQGVLIKTRHQLGEFEGTVIERLLQRVKGSLKADQTKYIMMHAPRSSLERIRSILPGMEDPTIIPLGDPEKCVVHAVARETVFWETMEALKRAGASAILVMPIEKIID